MPGLKRWLKPLGLTSSDALMVTRLIGAFVHPMGRTSCLQAAGEDSLRWQIELFFKELKSELVYLSKRLKTRGGIAKLQKLLRHAIPAEYRAKL